MEIDKQILQLKLADGVGISFRKDGMLNITLCIIWSVVLLLRVKGVLNHLPLISDYSEEILISFVICAVLLSLPAVLNKFCLIDYLFYIFNVFYLLACYAFFPENKEYLDDNVLTCIFCVFTYYFVGRLIDINKFFNVFLFFSVICILVDLYYYTIYAPQHKVMEEVVGNDNMFTAYRLMPHVGLVLWAALQKFSLWKMCLFIAGALFLLSCGTRGPLVCLGFFGIIYFVFYMNFRGAIYVKTFFFLSSFVLLIKLEDILLYLANTFTDMKLSTRIIEKFITGDIGNDSYRSELRERLEHVVGDGEHFWGLGAFGCRNYDIIYPHFLPLDFVCTYGYVLGNTLLVFLICLIVLAFVVSRGTKVQVFIVFLFSMSIIKLLLSNTFLLEPYFYMLIGVCMKEVLNWYQQNTKVIL